MLFSVFGQFPREYDARKHIPSSDVGSRINSNGAPPVPSPRKWDAPLNKFDACELGPELKAYTGVAFSSLP